MSKQDYYQTLGVGREATQADLKKAYRRLAMKYHPDRNPDDESAEAKFKEVKEAFEVLSDDNKRAAYDRFGHAGVDQTAGGGSHGAGFGDVFGDIFGDIFGGAAGARRGRSAQTRGADLRYNLEVSLEEAVKGCEAKIRVPTLVECGTCSGTGARPGTQPKDCSTCAGSGTVRMQQGFFSIEQPCPRCKGAGVTIDKPCDSCYGQGRIKDSKTLSVKIPAGVDHGDRIRLTGEGEAGERGGPAGDLYVQIGVKAHPIFTRDTDNLYCEVPISFVDAALGCELEVPTLDGRVKLKVPEETQTGKLFRLRGKGVTPVRGHNKPGDLLCRVIVETPVKLTDEQKSLLRQFSDSLHTHQQKHSPKAGSWFEGVKNFFDDLTS